MPSLVPPRLLMLLPLGWLCVQWWQQRWHGYGILEELHGLVHSDAKHRGTLFFPKDTWKTIELPEWGRSVFLVVPF